MIQQAISFLSRWLKNTFDHRHHDCIRIRTKPAQLDVSQPLHPCLLPHASRFSSLNLVPNPHAFIIGGRCAVMGHSGQPLQVRRYIALTAYDHAWPFLSLSCVIVIYSPPSFFTTGYWNFRTYWDKQVFNSSTAWRSIIPSIDHFLTRKARRSSDAQWCRAWHWLPSASWLSLSNTWVGTPLSNGARSKLNVTECDNSLMVCHSLG